MNLYVCVAINSFNTQITNPRYADEDGVSMLQMDTQFNLEQGRGRLQAWAEVSKGQIQGVWADAALDAYNSPGYQKALAALGEHGVTREIRIIEAL